VVTRYGVTKMLNGDTAGGAKLLLQVVSYLPDDALANRYLGWMMYRDEQYGPAAHYLGKLPPPQDVGLQSYHIELSRSYNHLQAYSKLVELLEPMYKNGAIPAGERATSAALYLTLAYAGTAQQSKAKKLETALRVRVADKPASIFGLDMGLAQINKNPAAGKKALKTLINNLPPAEAAGRLEMAKLYLEDQDILPALEEFEKALALAPEAGAKDILAVMIPALLEESMNSNALDTMQAVSDQYPNNNDFLYGLAELQAVSGMSDQAAKTVEKLLTQNPPHAPSYLLGASLASTQGDSPLVKRYLEQYVQAQPNKPQGWVAMATYYVEQKDFDMAIQSLGQGVKNNPADPGLRFELGSVYDARKEPEKAVEQYGKALQLKPDHMEAMDNLASNLLDMNTEVERAREYASVLYEKWPDDPYIQDLMGWAFYRTGELDKASKKLSSAATRMDKSGRADYHLALTLKDSGDERGAKTHFTRALAKGLPASQLLDAQQQLSSMN